jgi:hypothetical protein
LEHRCTQLCPKCPVISLIDSLPCWLQLPATDSGTLDVDWDIVAVEADDWEITLEDGGLASDQVCVSCSRALVKAYVSSYLVSSTALFID